MKMIYIIFIALIGLQDLIHCSELPMCPRPANWHQPTRRSIELPHHERKAFHWFRSQCSDPCHGPPPPVDNIIQSPMTLENVLENVELICETSRGNRITRIIVDNNQLRFNVTCNGVLSGFERNPGIIYQAVIQTKDNEEAVVPLKADSYYYTDNYLMGSESLSEKAVLKDGICDGGKLSSYSVWVADNPTQGCCGRGVRRSRAIYYRLEIRGGNCCTVCNLLTASDVYDRPLQI